jgi:uncharacterized protein (DUF2336 family)
MQASQALALTEQDITLLLESPQDKKIRIADMLTEYYARGGFDEDELKIAGGLLMAMAEHAETEVRRHLAEGVKALPNVAPDIIRRLAADVASISVPVLECSTILTDEDLIEIVGATKDAEKLMAVTRRERVGAPLSDALILHGNAAVTERLLHNEGASISEGGYERILEMHGENTELADAMATRNALPVHIVERLVAAVSEKVQERLVAVYDVDPNALADVMRDTGDMAVINIITNDDAKLLYGRFRHFAKKHNFPDSFLPLLSLCIGNMQMFAVLAGRETKTPLLNVRYLLGDGSGNGFRALYRRMKLPAVWMEPCAVLADVLREWEAAYGKGLYQDVFLRKEYADKYYEEFTERAAAACEDRDAVAAIGKLLQNSLLLCRKETG